MSQAFNFAMKYLIGDEGTAFTVTKDDAGGPTKYGVTLASYAAFCKRPVDAEEIKNLSLEDAALFYHSEYWLKLTCDKLESSVMAVCIFDTGVLYGVNAAAVLAQKTVSLLTGSTLKFDGVLGDNSVSLLNMVRDEGFIKNFHALILKRIDAVCLSHPEDEKFRRGWTNRADRLLTLLSAEIENS